MTYDLSDSAQLLEGQPMFKILSRIKELERDGRDIVHFEIGDPDFKTPSNVTNAAIKALNENQTHYSDSMGDYDFRKLIAENNMISRGFKPDINQVLVTPGANIIIYYAVRCLVNPGDEVIVQDPCFPSYLSVFKFCGVKPVFVPLKKENEFRLNPDDLREKITDKTRLIIINSPHNPTGSIMLPEELEEVGQIAIDNNIYLYCDEIYSRMNYGETPFYSPSILDKCKKRIIVANGFSKAFAMTGWRLGTVIGPEKVIEKMGLLLQTTSSCVSSFIQKAGIEAINGDQSEVKSMMVEYKSRRDLMVKELNKIDKISCLNPGGAFYVFLDIRQTGLTSQEFTHQLLETKGVGVCAGNDFGDAGEGFVRLCYATSQDEIKKGIKRIKEFVDNLE